MNKFRLLRNTIIFINTILFFQVLGDFFMNVFARQFVEDTYYQTPLGVTTNYIDIVIGVFLIVSLYKAQHYLSRIVEFGDFKTKNSKVFRDSGIWMLLYSVLSILFQFNFFEILTIRNLSNQIMSFLVLLIVGFAIIVFSEILQKGELIKHEQDLTI